MVRSHFARENTHSLSSADCDHVETSNVGLSRAHSDTAHTALVKDLACTENVSGEAISATKRGLHSAFWRSNARIRVPKKGYVEKEVIMLGKMLPRTVENMPGDAITTPLFVHTHTHTHAM